MSDTLYDVTRWADRGDRIAIAMVVGAVGATPRPLGTKMAVNDRGEISGSISGGCVGAVVEIAERVSGRRELAHFGIADTEAWGSVCRAAPPRPQAEPFEPGFLTQTDRDPQQVWISLDATYGGLRSFRR